LHEWASWNLQSWSVPAKNYIPLKPCNDFLNLKLLGIHKWTLKNTLHHSGTHILSLLSCLLLKTLNDSSLLLSCVFLILQSASTPCTPVPTCYVSRKFSPTFIYTALKATNKHLLMLNCVLISRTRKEQRRKSIDSDAKTVKYSWEKSKFWCNVICNLCVCVCVCVCVVCVGTGDWTQW
jgi:hypothetical protein